MDLLCFPIRPSQQTLWERNDKKLLGKVQIEQEAKFILIYTVGRLALPVDVPKPLHINVVILAQNALKNISKWVFF